MVQGVLTYTFGSSRIVRSYLFEDDSKTVLNVNKTFNSTCDEIISFSIISKAFMNIWYGHFIQLTRKLNVQEQHRNVIKHIIIYSVLFRAF